MMKNEKTLRAALSGALILTVVAVGVTMYRQETNNYQKREELAQEHQVEKSSKEEQKKVKKISEVKKEKEKEEQKQENPQIEQLEVEDITIGEVEPVDEASANAVTQKQVLNFQENSTMIWPVKGEILINYSMDGTTYLQTLNQYRYHPAIVLSAAVDTPVKAVANGKILAVTEDVKKGTAVTMDLGNGYQATYGQLKNLEVEEGQVVETGSVLGYINEPTKYYVKEGSNLYFALTKDGKAVDPKMFLEIEEE